MLKHYTVEQVAEELGLHPNTVRNYIKERELKATWLKRYWVSYKDLERFLTGRMGMTRADVSAKFNGQGTMKPDINI